MTQIYVLIYFFKLIYYLINFLFLIMSRCTVDIQIFYLFFNQVLGGVRQAKDDRMKRERNRQYKMKFQTMSVTSSLAGHQKLYCFVSDLGESQVNSAMVCSGCVMDGLSPFPLLYMDRTNNCFELLTNTVSSLQHSERLMCWSVFFLTYAVSHRIQRP